ncbi:MAG TPA: penicillin-binding protein 2 [Acidimicrobiales bacterium]
MRPRKSVHVASLVASPEDQPSRPFLRLNVIAVIGLVLFGVMVLRLWTLQIIDHKNYTAAVSANGLRVVSVPAPRGDIVDRDDVVLVGNQVQSEIVLSRAAASEHPEVVGAVAALIGKSPSYVQAQLASVQYSVYQPVPLMTDAPASTVQYLQTHAGEFPGVSVQQVTERDYPQGGTLATHVLGYVGDITGTELAAHPHQGYSGSSQIGKSGLEAQYEQYLRGVAGRQVLEVNVRGDVVGTLKSTDFVQGDTLVTNIDANLQAQVQNALAADIAADRRSTDAQSGGIHPPATSGAAIVLNVTNGQVLAMASYPTYDLNEFVGGISQANLDAIDAQGAENDNAIQGLYAPGSTFKLVTATAALDKGIISAGQYVRDTGTYTVKNCTEGCAFHDDQGVANGLVNLPLALTESDDYYFYQLGDMFWQDRATYGDQAIQDVGEQYGLDSYTGIDLPFENVGYINSPAVQKKLYQQDPKGFPNGNLWTVGDNIEMAFGQNAELTPMQMAVAYATFANGGTRWAPEVANAVVAPDGHVVERIAPKKTGSVDLPPSVSGPILQGLEGAVGSPLGTAYPTFEGTAPRFDLGAFPLAGKTGTATVTGHTEPTAWFVAFGPEPNPQYVVLVVVDQGGYGADAAAPAVKAIYQYLQTNPVSPTPTVPAPHTTPSTVPATTVPPAGVTTTTTSTTVPPSRSTPTATTRAPGAAAGTGTTGTTGTTTSTATGGGAP